MTAPKYLIVEAQTLEARKHHRVLVEEALKNANLSFEQRAELAYELKQALIQENAAQKAEDEVEEEKKEKKGGEGDGGDEGSGSNQGSAGGSGGSGGGVVGDGGDEDDIGDPSEMELFELLFFLTDAELRKLTADDMPLAAATLLYNANEKTAHVHEPYSLEEEPLQHSLEELLPSLEHHAVALGAREMCVRVHPAAVELFRKKFGYKPLGAIRARKGMPLQRMRKSLPAGAHLLKNDVIN